MFSRLRLKLLALYLFLFLVPACFSQSRLTVMSFNAANLFDTVEEGSEYREFKSGRWDQEDLDRKCRCLARIITGAVRGGPDLLALQEVENRRVLSYLRDYYLKGMGYRYLTVLEQKGLSTHVAVLSRVPVLGARAHSPGYWNNIPLRHILELVVEVKGSRLYLFNNHWKSKSQGVEETEGARRQAAGTLARRLLAILEGEPAADILVLGDLNENVEEYLEQDVRYPTALLPLRAASSVQDSSSSLWLLPQPPAASLREGALLFYEPWYELPRSRWGSFCYRGLWQSPDHILLSAGLFDEQGFAYERGSFRVIGRPEANAFSFPLACSDHLPLLLRLKRNR